MIHSLPLLIDHSLESGIQAQWSRVKVPTRHHPPLSLHRYHYHLLLLRHAQRHHSRDLAGQTCSFCESELKPTIRLAFWIANGRRWRIWRFFNACLSRFVLGSVRCIGVLGLFIMSGTMLFLIANLSALVPRSEIQPLFFWALSWYVRHSPIVPGLSNALLE